VKVGRLELLLFTPLPLAEAFLVLHASDSLSFAIELGALSVVVGRVVLVSRERAAWAAFALALACWLTADTISTFWLAHLSNPPHPSVADGFYLAAYTAEYVGLILLLRARVRDCLTVMWLDGFVGGLALAAVGAGLVFPAIVHGATGSTTAIAVTLAYPLLDFLMACTVIIGLTVMRWRPGRDWAILGSACILMCVADCVYLYQLTTASYRHGGLLDSLWPLGTLLWALASVQPGSLARTATPESRGALFPAAFSMLALGLLMAGNFTRIGALAAVLAGASLVLATTRGAMTFVQNAALLRRERIAAITDPLTGLGNRRSLMAALDDVHATATNATLALFDLDGFKQYNDSFGHDAGDGLLHRLGERLHQAAGAGRAFRLGGDEFCVLLGGDAAEHLTACIDAMTENGESFTVRPSTGTVQLPVEGGPRAALRIADERMYGQKGRRLLVPVASAS
jgi:two-component system, cell cycle response regulator